MTDEIQAERVNSLTDLTADEVSLIIGRRRHHARMEAARVEAEDELDAAIAREDARMEAAILRAEVAEIPDDEAGQ